MACPFFEPLERRSRASDVRDAMLPLGDSWAGLCRAVPDQPVPPAEADLRPLCNLGYARGNCARFPGSDGPDAVRFAIKQDTGGSLDIAYVVERDHHPFANGNLLDPAPAPVSGELLARQAAAYAESYRRRKHA